MEANKQRAIEVREREAVLEKARRETHEERMRLKQKAQQYEQQTSSSSSSHSIVQVNDGLTAKVAKHIADVNHVVTKENKATRQQHEHEQNECEEEDISVNESLSQMVDDIFVYMQRIRDQIQMVNDLFYQYHLAKTSNRISLLHLSKMAVLLLWWVLMFSH
jgi:hypothetical protein